MGTIRFIGGLTFAAIFAVVIISYAIGFGADNSSEVLLSDDAELNALSSSSQSDLQNYKTSSDDASNILQRSAVADDNIEGGGPFKTTPSTVLGTSRSMLNVTTGKLLGGREGGFGFITTSILAFFGMVATLYIWKTWKGGNPD